MHTVIGIRPAVPGRRAVDDANSPAPTVWFDSRRQPACMLSDENCALLTRCTCGNPAQRWSWPSEPAARPATCSASCITWSAAAWSSCTASPDTRTVRPEALATEFLIVLD